MGICGLDQTQRIMKWKLFAPAIGGLVVGWLGGWCNALYAQSDSADVGVRLDAWSKWVGESDPTGARWVDKTLREWVQSPRCSPGKVDTIDAFVGKMKAIPLDAQSGGLGYLKSVAVLLENPQEESWVEWHRMVGKMAESQRFQRTLGSFLRMSPGLIGSGLLGEGPWGKWQVLGAAPQWGWDSIPFVKWENGMLLGIHEVDSSVVQGIRARWNVGTERLEWTGGRVEWGDEGMRGTETYALLKKGELRFLSASWEAPEAVLHSGLFSEPLPGRVVDKLHSRAPGAAPSYPRFESSLQRVFLKDIEPGMNFEGGVRLAGSALTGFGSPEEKARLTIYRNDTLFMSCQALTFEFQDRGIQANHVAWELKWEDGSIHHPDLQFRFERKSKRISAYRDEEGVGMQPFVDTYHAMDLEVDAISWVMGSPEVLMGPLPGMTARSGRFASRKFFSKPAYESMRGIEDLHPLVELNKFLQGRSSMAFTTQDYASYLRLSEVQARLVLIDLARKGFLQLDLEERSCLALPKVQDYLHYNAGRKDYDLLLFASDGRDGVQARMSLLNGRLKFPSVGAIQVSTEQDVQFLPNDHSLEIGEGLNFHFDGRIRAGNFDFKGAGFVFDYDQFTVQLNRVESVQISVNDPDKLDAYGNPVKQRILSQLEEITGTIQIDHPTNKSGRRSKEHPQFPIFTSAAPSYVYYDQPHVQGGAYVREKFYYEVEPFVFKSLDQFGPEDLRLTGTLHSGGIFPDLDLPLQWMPDRSLGIRSETPPSGAPLYGGLAQFTERVQLDFQGLRGRGTVDFRTATADSEDWLFLPDSTLGKATVFANQASSSENVPQVFAQQVETRLLAQAGEWHVHTRRDSLDAFGGEFAFRGELALSAAGMWAKGGGDLGQASLASQRMEWGHERILADTLQFVLRGGADNRVMFEADSVRAVVDLALKIGEFSSHAGETRVDFPMNQYHAYMDRFRWEMDPNDVVLVSDRPQAAEESGIELLSDADFNVQSDHPQQQSLRFLSPEIAFDVDEEVLHCRGVKQIPVADAAILPDQGEVVIRRAAAMDTLRQAVVYADRIAQYHRVFDASVHISGASGYQANGKLMYQDAAGRKSPLQVSNLGPEANGVSVGSGSIPVEQGFRLGPAFSFQGEFTLRADQPHLVFDGLTQPSQACGGFERNWIQFTAPIDPQDIAIPILEEPRGLLGEVLNLGVMVSRDAPFGAFPAFFSVRQELSDKPLMPVSGWLKFDGVAKRFLVAPEDWYVDNTATANWVEISTETCEVRSHGVADWPLDWGLLEADFVGQSWVDGEGIMRMKGSLALDFLWDDKLSGKLVAAFPGWQGVAPVDLFASGFDADLRHWMGEEAATEAMRDLGLAGQFRKIPKELQHTVLLTGVQLFWDPTEDAFASVGGLGLVLMGNQQPFLQIPGKLEFVPSRSGDVFRLYLHGDEQNWYFFEYKIGVMNISTPDFAFRDALLDLKADDRRAKGENGEKFLYQYFASKKKRDDFVDRFREFE